MTAEIGYLFPSFRRNLIEPVGCNNSRLRARLLDPHEALQKTQDNREKQRSDGEFAQEREGIRGLWAMVARFFSPA
jgi:hypothetical protein